jgi:hypothetical protein
LRYPASAVLADELVGTVVVAAAAAAEDVAAAVADVGAAG